MQSGDEIISINGVLVSNWEEMAKNIHSKPNEIIQISWERNEQIINGSVQTVIAEQPLPWNKHIMKGIIGIQPVLTHRNITILESFSKGFMQTYFWLEITYKTLLSLMQGNVSMKEMAGPIMIAKMAGETATTGGFYALLGLMGIISVNLGLINILPIPGLDGGHVFIAIIEGLRRKELPLKVKYGIQSFGFILIMILFVFVFFNDIRNLM